MFLRLRVLPAVNVSGELMQEHNTHTHTRARKVLEFGASWELCFEASLLWDYTSVTSTLLAFFFFSPKGRVVGGAAGWEEEGMANGVGRICCEMWCLGVKQDYVRTEPMAWRRKRRRMCTWVGDA